MRQQWIPLFVLITILLLTCLSNAGNETTTMSTAAAKTTKDAEKIQPTKEPTKEADEKKKKEDDDGKDLKQYMYYGAIGGCSVSAVINAIFFILACKGCICKPKPAPTHQTLDVL